MSVNMPRCDHGVASILNLTYTDEKDVWRRFLTCTKYNNSKTIQSIHKTFPVSASVLATSKPKQPNSGKTPPDMDVVIDIDGDDYVLL